MKTGIHPKYYWDAKVICACGNTWTTGATVPVLHVEVCSKCHPFFTGEQRIVDTEGQVDRFMKRLQIAEQRRKEREARRRLRTSPERPVQDLPLPAAMVEALRQAGLATVGQILERMDSDAKSLVDLRGVGHRGFIQLRKVLRKEGFQIPAGAEEIPV